MVEAVNYKPSKTGLKFHRDKKSKVRLIKGPVGSGKSVACVNEVFDIARKQRAVKGYRKSRWAIIRKTEPELKTTTIKTWEDWFGIFGKTKYTSPISFLLEVPMTDGTLVQCEILFISQPDKASIEKLKSLELTGAYINEASELSKESFDLLTTRITRYPAKRDGGANWFGIIMDSNSFDETHWLYKLFYTDKPASYALFDQPPALQAHYDQDKNISYSFHPDAENIENLNDGIDYYLNMIEGKSKSFVEVIVMNQIGACEDGDYVYASHYLPSWEGNWTDKIFDPNHPKLIITSDQNYSPMSSAVIQNHHGIDHVVDEIILDNAGAAEVANEIVARYKGYRGEIILYGDRYGLQGKKHGLDYYYKTIVKILNENGFHRVRVKVPGRNPPIKDCQDSLKARLCDSYEQRKFKVNPDTCPTTDLGLRKTAKKAGSAYIEIENRTQHVTTACRYYTHEEYESNKDGEIVIDNNFG
jgi:hypothetical protein